MDFIRQMLSRVITRTIFLLSLVSLLNDISSEMLYPVMPLFLSQIGFSVLWMGVMEGAIELIAGLGKNYFGAWSDASGRRMPFIRLGYLISAFSKPMMALFTHPLWIFSARSTDRIGKGIRTAARDALLADESDTEHRGKVFGFHKAMDTLGATIGPLIALAVLHFYPEQYTLVFALAFIPALAAVSVTWLVRDKKHEAVVKARPGFFAALGYWKRAPQAFRAVALPLWLFTLINSSDLFLLMKVKSSGMNDTDVITAYVFYNLVFAICSYPMGRIADRMGFRITLLSGMLLFACAYAVIALGTAPTHFAIGFFLYGLYAATSEGIMKAWISTLVARSETASAMGCFTGGQSILALAASSLTGLLWVQLGATPALLSTAIAAVVIIAMVWRLKTVVQSA